jgi:hypothetical protein
MLSLSGRLVFVAVAFVAFSGGVARASVHLGLLDEAEKNLQIARTAGVSPESEIAALDSEIERARLRASASARTLEKPVGTPAASATRPERTAPVDAAPLGPLPGPTPTAAGIPESVPAAVTSPAAEEPRELAGRTTPRTGGPSGAPPTPSRTSSVPTAEPSPQAGARHEPGEATVTPSRPLEQRPGPLAPHGSEVPAGTKGQPRTSVSLGSMALIASGLGLLVLVATRAALAIRARRRPSPAPLITVAQLHSPVSSASSVSSAGVEEEPSLATSLFAVEKGSSPSGFRASSTPTPAGVRPLREGTDTRFGAYVLEAILGRGGMGTTYVARRLRDGFPVALKVPHEHILEEPEFVERFLREGALGAMLRHPNIVRIYEAGEHDGRPFIAMEIVPGTTLERVLRLEQRLPLPRALHVARGIALALDYAHLKGIVHRDLKPENVMVLPDGEVKVMDYGIARRMDVSGLTATDAYLGTPNYSAPESLIPSEVGPHSDLYSLGVILFRMLAGALPFTAPTPFELLHKHAYEPLPLLPPGLGVPPEVYGLLLELTAKSREERYATAELFLRDLDQILNRL